MSVNEKMTAIADAIRDKTGGTEALTLDGMAENVPKVYESGKKTQYDRFWGSYQSNGDRRNYKYGFAGAGWDNYTFNPKYDIVASTVQGMFQETNITDLVGILDRNNVKLMTTNASVASNMFYSTKITEIPELDFSTVTGCQNSFYNCTALKRIAKVILSASGTQTFSSTFNNCRSLTDITFEGVIGRDINFSSSPLSIESMKSIITHLKDYKGTESEGVYTVTFTSACKTALEAEGDTSPNGNTWIEYIANLGWIC